MIDGNALVIAVHDESVIDPLTAELVTAAREVANSVTLGIVAANPEKLAELAVIEGVVEIVGTEVHSDRYQPDGYCRAVEVLIDEVKPRIVIMGFTVGVASYAAALANRRGFGFAADVIALAEEPEQLIATRALYGGKLHGDFDLDASIPAIILCRPAVWSAAGPGPNQHPYREIPSELRPSAIECIEAIAHPDDEANLAGADIVFCIGRGIGSKERIPLFEEISERIGAELGASRPVVDSGWLPSTRQIGQSGQTVKPRVYVAFGVSGSLQHLAGIWGSEKIVAINLDASAPIFSVAHVGAVADMFDVVDELQKLVQ